jgi:hypothetical protein
MRAQSKTELIYKPVHPAVLENDGWVWGVIFTTAALTALGVVALLGIAIG